MTKEVDILFHFLMEDPNQSPYLEFHSSSEGPGNNESRESSRTYGGGTILSPHQITQNKEEHSRFVDRKGILRIGFAVLSSENPGIIYSNSS